MTEIDNVPGLDVITIWAATQKQERSSGGMDYYDKSQNIRVYKNPNRPQLATSERIWKLRFKNNSTQPIDVTFAFSKYQSKQLIEKFEATANDVQPGARTTLAIKKEYKDTRLDEVRVYTHGNLLRAVPQTLKMPPFKFHLGLVFILLILAGTLAIEFSRMENYTWIEWILPRAALVLGLLAVPGYTPTLVIAILTGLIIASNYPADAKGPYIFFCILYLVLLRFQTKSWFRYFTMLRF